MKKNILGIAIVFLLTASGVFANDTIKESKAFSSLIGLSSADMEQVRIPEPVSGDQLAIDVNKEPDSSFLRKSDPASEYIERDFLDLNTLKFDDSPIPSKSIPTQYMGHSVGTENFAAELTQLTGARFTKGNSAKLLFGPDSFAMRDKLMAGAKKGI